ncbi:MAG: DUF4783 domain-containing protein [Chitinophagaceae bacterium]|nr:DUF4783 domain-containing protein [Chitinophagaceae bacterium]
MQKFLTLACAMLFVALASFKPLTGLDEVIAALKTGNASELSRYLDDNVEISLPDKANSYSKAQSVMILQDFFSTTGVRNFQVKHNGNNGGNQFCIGTLQTRSGNYLTTIFMKSKNGYQLIKQVIFQSL